MNQKQKIFPKTDERIVYVRRMAAEELPDDAPKGDFHAIFDASGQQIGMAPNRALAFVAARQHELSPVSVH